MPDRINETHDPRLESWVESANDPSTDFPIQNLPFCAFVHPEEDVLALGVRIGDALVDIAPLHEAGLVGDPTHHDHAFCDAIDSGDLNTLSELGADGIARIRRDLQAFLRADASSGGGQRARRLRDKALIPAEGAELLVPVGIRDYTDFYASIYHATNVGSMFRPDNPLLANYKHIPIGYHGRASSIVASGSAIRRPIGQQSPGEEGGAPGFGACKMLDYEMEMGAIIARGNELGESISIADAEDHILGLCILNDWSARDLQKWEYQPLGPFLAKNFASTVSAYIVTVEALAPFRCSAFERDGADPQPLAYMDSPANRSGGGFDITLEVRMSTERMRVQGVEPVRISRGNFRDMYWTFAQMVAHHTVNGCNLQPGDLLGSGTVSGTARDARGSLLELTWDGDPFGDPPLLVPGTQRTPLKMPTGEERKFLQDGDEVVMTAYCEREGFRRIGFGECRGIITPARGHA